MLCLKKIWNQKLIPYSGFANAPIRADFEIIITSPPTRFHSWKHCKRVDLRASSSTLLLARREGPPVKERSEAVNAGVSKPGRLHNFEIPKVLSVSSAVTSPRHYLSILHGELSNFCANRYCAFLISGFFEERDLRLKTSCASLPPCTGD